MVDGAKSLPQMYLRPPEFAYCAFELFAKTNGREQNVRETDAVYKYALYEACFQHNLTYDKDKDI